MKKLIKVISIVLVLFLIVVITIPFVLESKIETIIRNYADNNMNAELNFDSASLSIISSFPNTEVHIKNMEIINRSPFKGETLATASDLYFQMPIKDLFKGPDETLTVNEITANELLLTLKTNTNGSVNYDIFEPAQSGSSESESQSSGFSFNVKHYEFLNCALTYIDEVHNSSYFITEFDHDGHGKFSDNQLDIETTTDARISISVDSTEYLSNNRIRLEALVGLDLDKNRFTFKENKGFINELPIEFEGNVILRDEGQDIDIRFKNPESSFKDLLALIPSNYSTPNQDIKTTGNFTLKGEINGQLTDSLIPSFDINLKSSTASFQYPNLPKGVDDIEIDVRIINTTGLTKDTYIDLNRLNFRIDEDVFTSEAHIKSLTERIDVRAKLKGILNLANLTKAYPIELDKQLSGLLDLALDTNFDVDALRQNVYTRIKNRGRMYVTDFVFSSKDIVNPIQINKADLVFEPGKVNLKQFEALTGESDLRATGTLYNLLGFLLSDKKLEGRFNVDSDTFVISDFMVEDQSALSGSNKTTSEDESLKIPDFLNCTIQAKIKKVIYDNLTLKNVKGDLEINNQVATLKRMTTDLFNGSLSVSGNVSTRDKQPDFDLDLGMRELDVSQSFNSLQMLKAIAPIAKVFKGKLNSNIAVKGILDETFSPELNSISGTAIAEILTSQLNPEESPLLQTLHQELNFIKLQDLNLKELKTQLTFDKGQVLMKPFTLAYKDIPIEISGSHSFDKSMNYKAVFMVPAKYLGSDINRLIGQINDPEVNTISIPITADINGTFNTPKMTTDLSSSITKLSKQLLDIQKQRLVGKGKDKLNDLLGGIIGSSGVKTPADSSQTKKDSTKTTGSNEEVKKGVKTIFKTLFDDKTKSDNKKAKDSTKN